MSGYDFFWTQPVAKDALSLEKKLHSQNSESSTQNILSQTHKKLRMSRFQTRPLPGWNLMYGNRFFLSITPNGIIDAKILMLEPIFQSICFQMSHYPLQSVCFFAERSTTGTNIDRHLTTDRYILRACPKKHKTHKKTRSRKSEPL